MFDSSFLPGDSMNSNVHFCFDVLLHPRFFRFVINAADTCNYATNETRAFCAMDNHVESSVLRAIKTKTGRVVYKIKCCDCWLLTLVKPGETSAHD